MRRARKNQKQQMMLTLGLGGGCAVVAALIYLASISQSPQENNHQKATSPQEQPVTEEQPVTAVLVETPPPAPSPTTPEQPTENPATPTPPTTPPPTVAVVETPTEETIPTPAPEEKEAEVAKVEPEETANPTPPPEPMPEVEEEAIAKTLLINAKPITLVGIESTREDATNRRRQLMEQAADDKQWSVYQPLLKKSLEADFLKIKPGHGVSEFKEVWKNPTYYQALLQWNTLHLFPPHTIASSVKDSYYANFFVWILENNEAMEQLLLTMEPEDDPAKVLKFLSDAHMNSEDKYEKYFNLALACAVVFDEDMDIPNIVGEMDPDFYHSVDPMERYLWYIEQNDKGQLEAAIDRMSARDLVWVVCAPVDKSELEWAVKKVRLRRKSWGRAYGKIEYLMERAVEGLNPYKEYSFAELEEEGGICGDQTYYTVNTARANGIPAIGLSGETSRGGHAWAAIKTEPDEWDTSIGRIDGASKGQARNPQTGQNITEQEILLWNDRDHKSESVTLGIARHLWLARLLAETKHKEQRIAANKIAHKVGETFPETWVAIYKMLEDETTMSGDPKKPDNLDEWESFVSDMRREFRENPRFMALAAKAEQKYIFPYIDENDARRALYRERRQIERYSAEQVDLIAKSVKREADLIAKSGEKDADKEVCQLYDKALRNHGANITGFKIMANDYFNHFSDDKDMAPKVVRDIELAYKRVIDSGDKEYFRAKTEAGILEMICEFYRACGEEKRAEMLEKRQKRDMERAKRGAL